MGIGDPVDPRTGKVNAWSTPLMVAGLVCVFVGERLLPQLTLLRALLSAGGSLLVLSLVARRVLTWKTSQGDERASERILLLAYAGCALALLGFLLAGEGTRWLGIQFADPGTAQRFETAATVVSSIVLSASLLPALAAHWAFRAGSAEGSPPGRVDRLRIGELATAGLTVGLAGPLLLLVGYLATEHDRSVDLSYFRTSSPGTATEEIVRNLGSPLEVLLFFPPANEVQDQVRDYFQALGSRTGAVEIREYDYLAVPDLASELGVVRDGTIVMTSGDRTERFVIPETMFEARLQLRTLDGRVQQWLTRLSREERVVYLTVGHGELNDRLARDPADTIPGQNQQPLRSIDNLRGLFDDLNFAYRDLGLQTGLASDVPPDAAMVVVLGPQRAFLEPELESLDRYLGGGGSLLLALEPRSEFVLGPLAERLGVEYPGTPLADDQQYVAGRNSISDRSLLTTDRVSSHASTSSFRRASFGEGLVFWGAGQIEADPEDPRVSVLASSLPSTFADGDGDFELSGDEQRQSFSLAIAVEGAGGAEAGEAVAGDMRALVYADAEMFSDFVTLRVGGLNAAIVPDIVRWLGHEEEFAGVTVSEADVPIVHTRAENVFWFYATILGIPCSVLALGLAFVRTRRANTTRRAG